jgi:DNA polymerase-3 subunit epsilon
MSLDFVAVDFETANYFRGSPCAVGLTFVRDGHIVGSESQYIYQEYFDPFCISIHGITKEDVSSSPPFPDVWDEMSVKIGDLPIVAHNAAFDTGVIRDALDDAFLPWPDLAYACTLVMGRRTYDLPSYRLPFVAEAAGVPFDPESHHKAESDSETAARIMLNIANRHGVSDLQSLAESLGIRLGFINANDWRGCTVRQQNARAGFGLSIGDITINPDADPNNPLYGMGLTFTGALSSMTRALAWQRVADCGGMPLDNVTKQTNLLVFGYQDASKLAPDATMSSKFKKALTLKDNGQDIEIIGEDDFLAMLQEAGVNNRRPA